MSSKKHKRCKHHCQPDEAEVVSVPKKSVRQNPYILFLILILLIVIFGKKEIMASIQMMMAGVKNEEEVVC